jgi:hypothetical protein
VFKAKSQQTLALWLARLFFIGLLLACLKNLFFSNQANKQHEKKKEKEKKSQ